MVSFDRQATYEFLLVFYSNYGTVFYRLRYIANSRIFYAPPVFSASAGGDPSFGHREFPFIKFPAGIPGNLCISHL